MAVEKPDPVLGDKPYWEFWVYSEAFAKRFKGFPLEGADPELKGEVHAIVTRIFKHNRWISMNRNYPEQYTYEMDIYFDSSIKLPLSERPRKLSDKYPRSVTVSCRRLVPISPEDEKALYVSEESPMYPKIQPAIFSDQPLDGRFSSLFGWGYHPNLVPGLATISLSTSAFLGSLVAPKAEKGIIWLSLFGDNPYDIKGPPKQRSYTRDIKLTFDPGPNPERSGYVRMPEALYRALLPKVTLAKMLNWCIGEEFAHSTRRGEHVSQEVWDGISRRCRDATERGKIDLGIPGKEGLQDSGF